MAGAAEGVEQKGNRWTVETTWMDYVRVMRCQDTPLVRCSLWAKASPSRQTLNVSALINVT